MQVLFNSSCAIEKRTGIIHVPITLLAEKECEVLEYDAYLLRFWYENTGLDCDMLHDGMSAVIFSGDIVAGG